MISRILLFSLLMGSQSIFAQIQITANDINSLLGSSVIFDNDTSAQITVDVGSAGADQNYTLDQPFATPPAMYTQSFVSPDMAPNGSDFPEANFAMIVDFENDSLFADIANYTTLEDDAWTQIGFVTRLMTEEFDTVIVSSREEVLLPFPLVFGSTWSSGSADTLEVIPGSSLITSASTMHEVDGWGKVTLPAGTFDCLRIRMDQTSSSSITFNGVPISESSSGTITYQWINAANGVLAAISSLDDETDPNFTMAGSSARIRSATTAVVDHDAVQRLTIAPNPVVDNRLEIQLEMEHAGDLEIRLISTAGGLTKTLWNGHAAAGENRLDLTLDSSLPNGIYPIEIITERGKSVRQVLVVR